MARFLEFRSLALVLMFTTVLLVSAFAQAPLHPQDESGGAHKFTIGVGHAYFAEKESEAKTPMVSAYVLNYDYVINKHWSVGTHNDLLIEHARSQLGESAHDLVERPVVTKIMGLYSPIKDAHLMFGVGDEIKRSENHLIFNLGVDYGIHILEGWEIAAELSYDRKIHGADSWIVGVGICRTIRRHHKG